MPTYEYECEKCGLKFEQMQPISAAPSGPMPEMPWPCPAHRQRRGRVHHEGEPPMSDRRESGGDCWLQRTGRTCCGRDERCGKPACGDEE